MTIISNRSKNNSIKGFSLVELISVIAIIGILAVIGLPNYYKFKAKSYQSEAKVALAAIQTGQRAFYVEYQGYHSSLQVIGYAPHGRMRYNIGFGNPGITPATYTAAFNPNTLSSKQICSGAFGTGADPNCNLIMNVPNILPGAVPLANSYLAAAVTFEDNLVAAIEQDLVNIVAHYSPILSILAGVVEIKESRAASPSGESVDIWTVNQNNQTRNVKGFGNETCYINCVFIPTNPSNSE